MELRKTRFRRNTVIHIYQNTVEGGLIFYSVEDFLVYYTIFCTLAPKYKVKILGLCLMVDHIHILLIAESYEDMSGFIKECTRVYSRAFNEDIDRKGKLFNSPFGFACKKHDKSVRTAVAYLYNNPVEKQLTIKAIDYRWNFLAYCKKDYPFSEKIVLRRCSWALRKAVEKIRAVYRKGKPLNYTFLRRIMVKLEKSDKESLVDYIISLYNVINYEATVSYFDSFENMVIAMDSNTGNEYEIKEDRSVKTDVPYRRMVSFVRENGYSENIKEVIMLEADQKIALINGLPYEEGTTSYHIRKFFHLPPASRESLQLTG